MGRKPRNTNFGEGRGPRTEAIELPDAVLLWIDAREDELMAADAIVGVQAGEHEIAGAIKIEDLLGFTYFKRIAPHPID